MHSYLLTWLSLNQPTKLLTYLPNYLSAYIYTFIKHTHPYMHTQKKKIHEHIHIHTDRYTHGRIYTSFLFLSVVPDAALSVVADLSATATDGNHFPKPRLGSCPSRLCTVRVFFIYLFRGRSSSVYPSAPVGTIVLFWAVVLIFYCVHLEAFLKEGRKEKGM